MMKTDYVKLIDIIKKEGFNAEYQTILDGDAVIDNEVAIYDSSNEIQLFYITDDEMGQLNEHSELNNHERVNHLKEIVRTFNPNIKVE